MAYPLLIPELRPSSLVALPHSLVYLVLSVHAYNFPTIKDAITAVQTDPALAVLFPAYLIIVIYTLGGDAVVTIAVPPTRSSRSSRSGSRGRGRGRAGGRGVT